MKSPLLVRPLVLPALLAGLLAVSSISGGAMRAQTGGSVDFARDVQPIFRQRCVGCHGPTQQMNGFRLDRRSDAMRGGTIAVIGPGNSDGSRLYHRLIGSEYGPQMPPTGALRPDEIQIIKTWIDEGAQWPDELANEAPLPPADPRAGRMIDALRAGNLASFRTLAAATPGAADLRGPGGWTPLMAAVLYGDAAAVRALLDAGANPNIRNDAGATALMWAVNDLEKTRLLIDRGADVNAKSDNGRTPLLIAAGLPGSTAVVGLLLDRGAATAVKAPGLVTHTTPLTEAAITGDESVFRLLVQRGADPKQAQLGALALARWSGCSGCVDTLLPSTAPDLLSANMMLATPPLGPSLGLGFFLDRGADANATDPQGRNLLMLVAASDAVPVEEAKLLIARGIDVNAKSPRGETALSLARLRGNTPLVDLLLKAGARDDAPAAAPSLTPAPAASARAAVDRAMPLLQQNDVTFLKKAGCVSCHNNTLTAVTVATARKQRIPVNETIARSQVTAIASYLDGWRERALQGIGIPGDADTVSYILVGLAAENHKPDLATDAMAHLLLRQQAPDGRWRVTAHRPPIESSDIEVTATSMRALQVYAPLAGRERYQAAIGRAAAWLETAPAAVTEDRAFQLLGLAWSNADRSIIGKAARALIADQRPDGGWSQLPSLGSDAYATGQALVALKESSALAAGDPVYRRGVAFLLKTQLSDGSWFVKSRAIPLQPHFESGFPHGKDQFISAAASNWAVTALAYASGSDPGSARSASRTRGNRRR